MLRLPLFVSVLVKTMWHTDLKLDSTIHRRSLNDDTYIKKIFRILTLSFFLVCLVFLVSGVKECLCSKTGSLSSSLRGLKIQRVITIYYILQPIKMWCTKDWK